MVALRTLSDNVAARMTDGVQNVAYYDGHVTGTPGQMYFVGYPDAGNPFQDRSGDIAGGLDWGCTFVVVGRTRAQVATAVDLVRARNRGWTPDPLGGAWVEQGIGARILRDDTKPAEPLFSFTLRYTTTTRS